MRHFDQDRAGKDLMHRCQWRRLYRNKGTFKRQFFLRTHPNPFMDEVGIEVVGQGNIDNRGVRLRCSGQLIPDTVLSFSSVFAGANPSLN